MSTMTPIHKILRNTFASRDNFDYENNRTPTAKKSNKKVQIRSTRMRDITHLTSSSDSSYSSDSLDNERYIKSQVK